jgi:hypothetical protein
MTVNRTNVQTNSPPCIPNSQPETCNTKRRRGAPVGNKNAVSHGRYSRQNLEANLAVLKDNTDLGLADREIFLAAWQIAEVARREPSNERLQELTVKRFLKLVMRKFGITDSKDEEALGRALDQVERDMLLPPDRLASLLKQLV